MEEEFGSDLSYETLIHDLNNVFETITEAAELLSSDKRWKPLAATLSRSVTRGKRLLGAIPDRSPDLASVLDDAIQSITDYCIAARKPRMKFICQIPPRHRLPGSAKDWERVFENLFLNSLQSMQKPGRIDITAHASEERLAITVCDNGPGIPPEILTSVFQPHFSTKEAASGRSGLGLHIVALIVQKYAGRVLASNRERGTGAIFTILLPAA